MTDTPTNPTVSDLLPPRVRSWIYGLTLAAQPLFVLIGALTGEHEIVATVQAVIAAAGFGVATLHRPKS